MQDDARMELPSLLDTTIHRCIACCRDTIELYGGADPDQEFASTLLAVIAALELALKPGPEQRQQVLATAEQISRSGATALRGYGMDEQILLCASACEEAANRCAIAASERAGTS